MERLNSEIIKAQTSDLQRAADFLEGAREVRAGSKKQRRLAQDMMLAGGAVAAADKIYQTGKKIVKGIKQKRAKKNKVS